MKAAVLGAGGTIAPAILRDLAASDEVSGILALDLDEDRAAAAAERFGAGRASAAGVDASDADALAAAVSGCGVLVNAASYRLNLRVMDAALTAGCAYVDLGGLYHVTAEQLARSDEFAAAGLLAVLGAGAGPGKTNVMAALGAARLGGEAEVVRCSSSGLDETPPEGISLPYALATLLDEMTVPPVVVRGGAAEELPPLSDGGEIAFPDPIGTRGSLYTLHSEVLTLPGSLGAADCDFRLSLSPAVEEVLRDLAGRPREEAERIRPAPPSPRTWSAQHVEVHGGGRVVTVTSVTGPHEEWGIGGGILSTGSVAAATTRLLARGELTATGALPPERCLPPEALFAELASRGTTLNIEEMAPAASPTTPTEVP